MHKSVISVGVLKEVFKFSSKIHYEFRVRITYDGWAIDFIDASSTRLVSIRLPRSIFEYYLFEPEIGEEIEIGVDAVTIADILSLFRDRDLAEITVESEVSREGMCVGKKLHIEVQNLTYSTALIDPTTIRKTPDIGIIEKIIDASKTEGARVSISLSELRDAIRSAPSEYEWIAIRCKPEEAYIFNGVEKKEIADFEAARETTSIYTIEYLEPLLTLRTASTFEIYYTEDEPCVIVPDTEFTLNFVVAPYVPEDKTPYLPSEAKPVWQIWLSEEMFRVYKKPIKMIEPVSLVIGERSLYFVATDAYVEIEYTVPLQVEARGTYDLFSEFMTVVSKSKEIRLNERDGKLYAGEVEVGKRSEKEITLPKPEGNHYYIKAADLLELAKVEDSYIALRCKKDEPAEFVCFVKGREDPEGSVVSQTYCHGNFIRVFRIPKRYVIGKWAEVWCTDKVGSPVYIVLIEVKKKEEHKLLMYVSDIASEKENSLIDEVKRQLRIIKEPPLFAEIESFVEEASAKLTEFDGETPEARLKMLEFTGERLRSTTYLDFSLWSLSEEPIGIYNTLIEQAEKFLHELSALGYDDKIKDYQNKLAAIEGWTVKKDALRSKLNALSVRIERIKKQIEGKMEWAKHSCDIYKRELAEAKDVIDHFGVICRAVARVYEKLKFKKVKAERRSDQEALKICLKDYAECNLAKFREDAAQYISVADWAKMLTKAFKELPGLWGEEIVKRFKDFYDMMHKPSVEALFFELAAEAEKYKGVAKPAKPAKPPAPEERVAEMRKELESQRKACENAKKVAELPETVENLNDFGVAKSVMISALGKVDRIREEADEIYRKTGFVAADALSSEASALRGEIRRVIDELENRIDKVIAGMKEFKVVERSLWACKAVREVFDEIKWKSLSPERTAEQEFFKTALKVFSTCDLRKIKNRYAISAEGYWFDYISKAIEDIGIDKKEWDNKYRKFYEFMFKESVEKLYNAIKAKRAEIKPPKPPVKPAKLEEIEKRVEELSRQISKSISRLKSLQQAEATEEVIEEAGKIRAECGTKKPEIDELLGKIPEKTPLYEKAYNLWSDVRTCIDKAERLEKEVKEWMEKMPELRKHILSEVSKLESEYNIKIPEGDVYVFVTDLLKELRKTPEEYREKRISEAVKEFVEEQKKRIVEVVPATERARLKGIIAGEISIQSMRMKVKPPEEEKREFAEKLLKEAEKVEKKKREKYIEDRVREWFLERAGEWKAAAPPKKPAEKVPAPPPKVEVVKPKPKAEDVAKRLTGEFSTELGLAGMSRGEIEREVERELPEVNRLAEEVAEGKITEEEAIEHVKEAAKEIISRLPPPPPPPRVRIAYRRFLLARLLRVSPEDLRTVAENVDMLPREDIERAVREAVETRLTRANADRAIEMFTNPDFLRIAEHVGLRADVERRAEEAKRIKELFGAGVSPQRLNVLVRLLTSNIERGLFTFKAADVCRIAQFIDLADPELVSKLREAVKTMKEPERPIPAKRFHELTEHECFKKLKEVL